MAISQKLHTKLVQKLILTPSLQQAIKLLPMSTLELADLLNQEMVENPLLEEVPTEDLQLAHMRHVEQPGRGPRLYVFGDDAVRILHRHVVTGEWHHAGAKLNMPAMERRLPERRMRVWSVRFCHRGSAGHDEHATLTVAPPLSRNLRDFAAPKISRRSLLLR